MFFCDPAKIKMYEEVVLPFFLTCLYLPVCSWLQGALPASVDVQWPFAAWNFFAATASLLGLLFFEQHRVLVLTVYSLTKPLEFLDSFFIIARRRKQPKFLHLYHHLVTSTYCLYSYSVQDLTFSQVFCFNNLLVHTIMYFYFGCRLMGWFTPLTTWLRPKLTEIQIAQMWVGLGWSVIYGFVNGFSPLVNSSLVLYASFTWLFSRLRGSQAGKT